MFKRDPILNEILYSYLTFGSTVLMLIFTEYSYFFGNRFFLINSTAASSIVLSVDSTSFVSRSTISCLTESDFKKAKRIGLTSRTIRKK